jgi:MoxR-like ATPase
MNSVQEFGGRVAENLERVIVGKRPAVDLMVIGLLCQGHVLIEDVPGVGRTVLARSLARSLDCTFNRIQFTPDCFERRRGSPSSIGRRNSSSRGAHRTGHPAGGSTAQRQNAAALLEAMGAAVTWTATHLLPQPFMVVATQPDRVRGTFLPEAQLDRFLLQASDQVPM